tara:strand:+ start:692 stop:1171 length:480 start_codon:yes stop_codon:yes gene_type:complete
MCNSLPIQRIVSGGQTGVDRAALNVAIALHINHGGWCPRNRLAEDGRIPEIYCLTETESAGYPDRTRRNILDPHGTLILYQGQLHGGTKLTWQLAEELGMPHQLTDLQGEWATSSILRWITDHQITVLNVAGPRESSHPGIGKQAARFLERLLTPLPRR